MSYSSDQAELLELYQLVSRRDVHDLFAPDHPFVDGFGEWGAEEMIALHESPGPVIQTREGDFIFFVTFGKTYSVHQFDGAVTDQGWISWKAQPWMNEDSPLVQQFALNHHTKNNIFLFLRTDETSLFSFFGRLSYRGLEFVESGMVLSWSILGWDPPSEVLEEMGLELSQHGSYIPFDQTQDITEDQRTGLEMRGREPVVDSGGLGAGPDIEDSDVVGEDETEDIEPSPDVWLFDVNDQVRRKSDGQTGVIIDVLPQRQYRVFFSGNEQPVLPESAIELPESIYKFIDGKTFLKDLLVYKYMHPLSDTLYSYAASKTNFEVYQFKPVIKFVNNPGHRILIADEVGLGKTIEACLIYLELKARALGNIPRVLIVCPAGLTKKWRDELYARFGEQFTILNRGLLSDFLARWEIDRNGATLKGICSIELLRNPEIVEQITELNIEFDLVIVDEAHHMRNPDTRSFDLGELLSARSDAMVLLTATPVQLRALDLFYLLNILEPGEFERAELFEHQLEPNRNINRAISALTSSPSDIQRALAELRALPESIQTNPYFEEAFSNLEQMDDQPDHESMVKRIEIIRDLHKLNVLSHLFNRSRRSEVGSGTTRVANSIRVPLSPLELEINETALRFVRARAIARSGYAFTLGLIQIERQIASSLGAFKIVIDDFLDGRRTPVEVELSTDDIDMPDVIDSDDVYELAESLASLFGQLGHRDSKFDKFLEEIERLKLEHPKIMVFSFFKRTLEYLRRRLVQEGYQVDVIHGGVPPVDRQKVIESFEREPHRQILLSSEVGAEGQDFQFCDVVINYDLPWNPMRVEQRIGRIDRYGQKSDRVVVASFVLEGTIEERILMRLYERIGVFTESIGELEPILGEIVRQLSYESVTKSLTRQEEEDLVQRQLSALEHKKRDLQEFEDNRYELMGHDHIFTNEVQESIDSGRFISGNEIRSMVLCYLTDEFPGSRLEPVDETGKIWNLVPNSELLHEFERFLAIPGSRNIATDLEFLKKMSRPLHQLRTTGIPITFDNHLANQRRLLEFVNIWHLLARMAVAHYSKAGNLPLEQRMANIRISHGDAGASGLYQFFLFSMSSDGVIPTHELVPVLVDNNGEISPDLSTVFLGALQASKEIDRARGPGEFLDGAFRQSRDAVYGYMGDLRKQKEEALQQQNQALISVRKASLERTFQAKINRAQTRLTQALVPSIVRMHEGEIRNLNNKFAASIEELETRQGVSVAYEPVAFGMVRFEDIRN